MEENTAEAQKTYSALVVCGNCGKEQTVAVPFGTRLNKAIREITCDVCGCMAIEVKA